jgi:type VI secretion system protein ImpG
MFNLYYQTELTYLRELGKEFSEANPELTDLFAERGGDPDVERLLEGFAFLTARIRERIDDAVPELIASLTQLLLPHYLRTLPATSVVQFTPNPNALRSRHRVPSGTELGARPVQGTSCRFRTTSDLDLLPLSIEHVELDKSAPSAPLLRIGFRTLVEGQSPAFDEQGLRLYLNAPLPQASLLFLWLLRHLRSVRYRAQDGREHVLPAHTRAVGLAPEHGVLPWPRLAPEGPRLLQQYFILPQSMFFVDLLGLERVPAELRSERFELCLELDRPPPLPERVETEQFQLHCTPVVNLFEASADPIGRDPRMREYLLRASGVNPRHMEVYDVKSVIGVRAERRDRVSYSPFFDYAHAALSADRQAYFTLRRALSPIDGGLDSYLSVLTPRDTPLELSDETLSIDLVCTNRNLPAELRVGDISVPTPSSPTVARFRNLTGVSAPVPPPLGNELHWRLIAHLGLNQRSLRDPGALGSLLQLYNFLPTKKQQGRANELRATSVRAVDITPTSRLLEGSVLRGLRTRVEVDETQFAGTGDAFAFGCAIDLLFAAQVPLNSFNVLSLVLHPSGMELAWPPRNGNLPIL